MDTRVLTLPLNKLIASAANVRRTDANAQLEELAASIQAHGLIHNLTVRAAPTGDGAPSGKYEVVAGGRRLAALKLLVKRKQIAKDAGVDCLVAADEAAEELSLAENVVRENLHPADQFEAFRDLAERRGFSAEEIGARFGVSAQTVRQRLRLGAVSPKLMAIYRDGDLTLDQLMAFAVSEDHARQEQVFDQLSWNKSPPLIRRAMTEAKVSASDRRAVFVGVEAYAEAGGSILRDLFTEDGGGWLEDVAVLDRLVAEKLDAIAAEIRDREGWKWAQAHLDYPSGHGLARIYPHKVERTADEQTRIDAIATEYDALVEQWSHVEDLPPEVEARLKAIDAELDALGDGSAFDADEIARGGVLVILGHDGQARVERGLIRPEDAKLEPQREGGADGGAPTFEDGAPADGAADEPEEPDGLTPLAERLVLDLTAHRTVGLRNALAADPNIALVAVVHALALRVFFPPYDQPTCLEIKTVLALLDNHAPGLADTPAGRRITERHQAWAEKMPRESGELWAFVGTLSGSALLDLLAHCASLTVNAVHSPLDRKPGAWAHADTLAAAVGLDMTTTWAPTAASYLGRVTKARIAEAVSEAVSDEAAARIGGLKKPDMAEAAEQLLAGTGWLPPLLRTSASKTETSAADSTDARPLAAE